MGGLAAYLTLFGGLRLWTHLGVLAATKR